MAKTIILPPGLTYHCEACKLVIPSDAPALPNAECASVAQAKLSHFYPQETIATQHSMACATWSLIHREAFKGPAVDPEHIALNNDMFLKRKQTFAASAARSAMTPELVAAGAAHRRDGWLYKEES